MVKYKDRDTYFIDGKYFRYGKRCSSKWFDWSTANHFTGLLDRNGEEIYENDIVTVDYNYIGSVVVKYENGAYNISKYDIKRIYKNGIISN